MKRFTTVMTMLLSFLCMVCFSLTVSAAQSFSFHVLDVGQGESILVEADDHYMLIDGGGRESSSFVISYLKQQGVEKIDCVAVTHYDEDHMAGLIGVMNVFVCDLFIAPAYEGSGDLYRSFAVAALSNGCVIVHGKAGMEFSLGTASVEIKGPVQPNYPLDNDRSQCFRISYGDRHFLVCGDAEQSSETDMITNGSNLSSDLYVVNHHGSSTSSTDSFLDAVRPSYAVISCGKDNGYGHPSMETLQRLQNCGISLFRTDLQGTVIAYSDGNELWFNLDPTDDWTAGRGDVIPIENNEIESDASASRQINRQIESTQYVCNTNTKKFHYPDCNSVNQMSEKNRLDTDLSREELIEEGYEPCGNCHP